MADTTIVRNSEAVTEAGPALGADHNAALQTAGQADVKPPLVPTSEVLPVPKVELSGLAGADRQHVELDKISDETSFRAAVQDLIGQSKEGKDVKFDVDTRVAMTGADGKPTKETQASLLYDELKRAYPDNAFVFAKPELKPGDAGYAEIAAPAVTKDGGVLLSSKENPITTAAEISLADGSKLPAGSKFAVGTIYDGASVKSADPTGKVWAQLPGEGGGLVQVAAAGQSTAIPQDALSSDRKEMGQVANQGDHIVVRAAGGKGADGKPLVDPDGKPFLDAYPSSAESFLQNYKPGSSTDMWAAKAKSADHLVLPSNITVEAETAYGHSTASGTKLDYYMTSGFADARDATAKNYTGKTDLRSAQELMRIRGEVGLAGETQVEQGLKEAQAAAGGARTEEAVWQPGDQFKNSEGKRQGGEAQEAAAMAAVPRDVLDAMQMHPEQRSVEQRTAIDQYMKELGFNGDQAAAVDAKAREGIGKGIVPVAALGIALALTRQAMAAQRPHDQGPDTYGQ